ncbi:IS4 family transposase [Xanthocytophaga flava]|nr:IS4 family transposase [Xanthocytophaga flavus]
MSQQFKIEHRANPQNFIRQRTLGFTDIVLLQLHLLVKSLSVEVEKALSLLSKPVHYTKQAFSKARKKLRYTAFVALNKHFIEQYYALSTFRLYKKQYLLLAVDGSLLQLPVSQTIDTYFGGWKNQSEKSMPMARCSLIYDLLNHMVITSEIASCTTSENQLYYTHLAFLQSFDRHYFSPKPVYIMDRNYASTKRMLELSLAGNWYVIRCKSNFCKQVKDFIASKQTQSQLRIPLQTKPHLTSYLNSLFLTNPSLVNNPSLVPTHLITRIVRIGLTTGEDEYLVTNTDWPMEELAHLYQLRWGIESYYRLLKEKMQLENFASKTVEGIKQEFFAKIFASNLVSVLITEAQSQIDQQANQKQQLFHKQTKYSYRINQNVAIGLIKDHLLLFLLNPTIYMVDYQQLIERIKKYKIPWRPGRTFPRPRQKSSRRKFPTHKRSGL